MDALGKLQEYLKELFQLDLADLDFGIYRLLHIKRDEIHRFLTEQLPRRVTEAFERMAGEMADTLKADIEELAGKIREDVADDALLENGDINPEYGKNRTKAAKRLLDQYGEKWERLKSIQASEAEHKDVFNHLYAFFSRYYENGDFIPRRRYGARETYAVPYNGEETFFHWANRDQHYVKSGERFKDYAFSVETPDAPHHIRFSLTDASLPPGDTKGDARYFFPMPDQSIYDGDTKIYALPFHYRPPNETDLATHGNQKNSRLQEAILDAAIPAILAAISIPTLCLALSSPSEPENPDSVSILGNRLRHFCKKNTSDHFVHKDLKGFLQRELEFYLKDQVLHLADMEGDIQPRLRTLRVIRTLADEIIGFLTQIEDVQKHLFEKRKLVLRTDYIIPIKEIPKAFRPEIIANPRQIKEWHRLFGIDPGRFAPEVSDDEKTRFLETHSTLIVNTAFFDADFKNRLLSTFTDLDEAVDGLLVHSENYQALRFLERKYADRVKCIYIDPPYNTGSDEFIYKDRYRHSSWLAMIEERLAIGKNFLSEHGAIFVSIDDNEVAQLRSLMNRVFGDNNFIATLIWEKMYSPKSTARHFSESHDFILSFGKNKEVWQPGLLPRTQEADARYENPDDDPRDAWKPGDLSARNYYSKGEYEVISPSGRKFCNPKGTYWRVSYEKFQELDKNNRIWWGPNKDNMPALKRFLSEVKQGMVPQTLLFYRDVGHTQEAKKEIISIVDFARTEDVLNTVKPTRLLRRILDVATDPESRALVLDFFAGSGSTGDAVIRKNREDGGNRKFILVEMGSYFDNIIMQRIQRAMFSPEWKDCRPKRLPSELEIARTPRIIKVMRLESNEDALHNLVTEENLNRESPRAEATKEIVGGDGYRLSYLIRLPLETSASMLNLASLDHPFDYRMEILTDAGPRIEAVDLVETFNFLYGLHVERLETWVNASDNRSYRAVKARDVGQRRILVLWRDMTQYDPAVERAFLETKLREEAVRYDELLINSDTATPGFRSLDGIFKQLISEGER